MVIAIGDVYVQIPRRQAAEEAMLRAQTLAQDQDGCLSFAFAEALGDPGHFLVVQRWREQAALEAHYRSPAFSDYQAAIGPLLVRDSEMHLHQVQERYRPVESSGLHVDQDD
jgi:quinol monooxygenase YgiN